MLFGQRRVIPHAGVSVLNSQMLKAVRIDFIVLSNTLLGTF